MKAHPVIVAVLFFVLGAYFAPSQIRSALGK